MALAAPRGSGRQDPHSHLTLGKYKWPPGFFSDSLLIQKCIVQSSSIYIFVCGGISLLVLLYCGLKVYPSGNSGSETQKLHSLSHPWVPASTLEGSGEGERMAREMWDRKSWGGKGNSDTGTGDVGEGHLERSGRADRFENTIRACHFVVVKKSSLKW